MAVQLGRPQRKDVMMRLGLFTVPMSVYGSTVSDKDSEMHTVCAAGHPPIRARQRMYCPDCEAEYGFVKGKEVDGRLVVIPPTTVNAANAADLKFKDEMELTIHPEEQVSAALVPSGKTYWLGTNDKARAPYKALVQLVESRPDLAFMCRWTIRSVAATYWLRHAGDGTLMLVQMADPALMRELPVVADADIDARHMKLIEQLADLMITDFEPVTGRGKSNVLVDFFREHAKELSLENLAAPTAGAGLSDLQAALAAAVASAGARPTPKSKRAKKSGKKAA